MWVLIIIIETTRAFFFFGGKGKRVMKLMTIVAMLLNNVDFFKDLKVVIINQHSLFFTLIFSVTIVAPIFITIYRTKTLLVVMRN